LGALYIKWFVRKRTDLRRFKGFAAYRYLRGVELMVGGVDIVGDDSPS